MRSQLPDLRTIDITPKIPDGLNIITSYGDGYFKIKEKKYNNNILLSSFEAKNYSNIAEIKSYINPSIDTTVIYASYDDQRLEDIENFLRDNFPKISSEFMSLNAAYRTFNVLASDGRNVYGIFHLEK